MIVAIARWGNSLAVRLPKSITTDVQLNEGDKVNIHIEDGNIIMSPSRPRYNLDELLRDYRQEHRHNETDWGESVGKEHA